jgi:hypothetical protein
MTFVTIRDLLERRGHWVALALAAVVLLSGLGRSGLWEPWEMDRADLARTLVEPGQVAAAVANEGSDLRAAVDAAAAQAGLVVRHSSAESTTGRSPTGGARLVREALDRARTDVGGRGGHRRRAHRVPARQRRRPRRGLELAVRGAGLHAQRSRRGRVAGRAARPGRGRPRHRVARVRGGYEELRKTFQLQPIEWPAATDPSWDAAVADLSPLDRLVHLKASDSRPPRRGAPRCP